MVRRFDVWLVSLDPTQGVEIKKTRPGIIISPDEMNVGLNLVIIAPMTSKIRGLKTRVKITFQGKQGEAALDQMRAIDKSRLVKKLGVITPVTASKILSVLAEIFAE